MRLLWLAAVCVAKEGMGRDAHEPDPHGERLSRRCAAGGVDHPCARSNVLPPAALDRVRSAGADVLALEVEGYAGLVSTLPLTIKLRSWTWPGIVYATRRGEIVKLWSEADQSWWTEGDEKEIPFDVSMITEAAPW
jgi:hypothetical protein